MNINEWLEKNSNIESVNVATPDLNGVLRGKNISSSQLYKIQNGDFRMPFSVQEWIFGVEILKVVVGFLRQEILMQIVFGQVEGHFQSIG